MRLHGSVLAADNWFAKNAAAIARVLEVLYGFVWAADAALKFQPSFLVGFSDLITGAAAGQPAWLEGWFLAWAGITSSNPALFAYFIALLETALSAALVLGLARKLAYGGGFIFSLLIWSVPEGFGGPYGPSSTDIGTGIIYAFVFVFLAVAASIYGASRYTLDYYIEKRFAAWKSIAEIKRD